MTYNVNVPTGYYGSLAGVNANLLFISTEATSYNPVTFLNSIITSLGGTISATLSGTGIYIKFL